MLIDLHADLVVDILADSLRGLASVGHRDEVSSVVLGDEVMQC